MSFCCEESHKKIESLYSDAADRGDRFSANPGKAGGRGAETKKTQGRNAAVSGSLTVEAAACLPLFFLGMVTLILMMNLYAACASHVLDLQEKAEKAAEVKSAAVFSDAEDFHPVIDLYEPFSHRVQGIPHGTVSVACRARVRAWVGYDRENEEEDSRKEEKMVYVTESGKVYHTTTACSHLHLTILAVPFSRAGNMRNSGRKKYRPCEKCTAAGGAASVVYVTEDGDRYHSSAECSGLKRSVQMVRLSEVSGMRGCRDCAGTSS